MPARRLLDLAAALSGPPSTSGSAGSIDLFSEIDPEGSTAPNSTAPNSTSPSEADDDSVADKHYNPNKDARQLDHDESEDMDVDSDDPEEISPLVKAVKTHVRGFRNHIIKTGRKILFGIISRKK